MWKSWYSLIQTEILWNQWQGFSTDQSYLSNRYCRTAIYNGNENRNKVSNWARVRHGIPQDSVLGPLLFLLYVNDLPKIINKTSQPISFADDTSILFAHSTLIDFNKNIYIVFTTLNEWLRANKLSLNFNKTNYVHFTTKRNMSVNLEIGFNNNFITNSSSKNSWVWQWIVHCLGIIILIYL